MFVDTGVMIELMNRPKSDSLVTTILAHLKDEPLFWSSLQFAELADSCRRKGHNVDRQIGHVSQLVEEVAVDRVIALLASELKAEARAAKPGNPFGLADGIILATARTIDETLLTLDPDFDCFADVTVISA